MKKLTLILSLIFTVTLSSPSYAEWEKVGGGLWGHYYVNLKSIQKLDGKDIKNVYIFEHLTNYTDPSSGYLSTTYRSGAICTPPRGRFQIESRNYSKPWGQGSLISKDSRMGKWQYPVPTSISRIVLDMVCNH